MSIRPFAYRLPNRNEPVIEAGDRGPLAPRTPSWSGDDQNLINPWPETMGTLGVAGGAVAGLGAIGRSTFGGKKGWDYYHRIAKEAEEASPGAIFRTFGVSQSIQPFTTSAQAYRFIPAESLKAMAKSHEGWMWLEHLEKVLGQKLEALGVMDQGLTYRNGTLYLGQTKQVVLKHAFVMESGYGQLSALQKGYIRSVGKSPWYGAEEAIEGFTRPLEFQTLTPEEISASQARFRTVDPTIGRRKGAFWIGGGQTRLQSFSRFVSGYGTTLAERMNQLARAPFEIEPFATVFKKLPLRFGVEPGSGLRTLGKLTGKLGIATAVLYGSYSYLDYAARQSEMLDDTFMGGGITSALATLWTKTQMGIAAAGEAVGAQSYVKKQEEIAPRSTSLGALLAYPLMGGLAGATVGYGLRLKDTAQLVRGGWKSDSARRILDRQSQIYKMLLESKVDPNLDMSDPKGVYSRLEKVYKRAGRAGTSRPSGFGAMEAASLGRAEKDIGSIWGRAARRIAEFGHGGDSFFRSAVRKLGYMTPSGVKALLGVGVGLGLVLPFLPGALLPGQTTEELDAIYSGRKNIPVRKSRWWEFGRTPYEGENAQYFRPHWYPRMLARGREKAIYGDEEMSPLEKFYAENFTYEMEKKHYFDRPYPITGTAFQDVPLIGPLLAATIGKLVKPPRLMHTDEWMRARVDATGEASLEFAPMAQRYGYQEAPGELEEGAPVSPYGAKGIIGEQAYRMTEMIGLPGFSMGAVKEKLTGEETLFAQERQLESAQRMYGAERAYWDLEVGGGLGSTELFRRLYPHRRREIPLYNPIRNLMPEWLPGPGERSPDFLHGDPYAHIKEGEIRLPGPGYAALNPELEGVSPEDYPAFHRYKILADIAPYSSQFQTAQAQARSAAARGLLHEDEVGRMQVIKEELAARKKKKTFYEYKFKPRAFATEAEAALTAWNEAQKEEPSAMESALGRYWEAIAHGGETPMEYLTPLSPYNKLVHVRTALEEYEAMQVYGTKNAFWGNPVRDFMRPFASAVAASVGADDVPGVVQSRRETEEYFDMLEYVKYTGLERQAQVEGDMKTASEFAGKRRETLFGVDPYTYNYSQIFRSLPRRDRDYFNEFVKADLDERSRLKEILPSNEQQLYEARWELEDAANAKKAMKKGLLTQQQSENAQAMIEGMYESKRTEGMPVDKQLWAEYVSTRFEGESYADWYRRTYLLAEKLDGKPLPGPDWVGWHPMVNMEDIKLKVVQGRQENPIDYDIWPDQERLLARRPEVQAGAEALEGEMSPEEVRRTVSDILSSHNLGGASVTVTPSGGRTMVDINISQDRTTDVAYLGKRDNLN